MDRDIKPDDPYIKKLNTLLPAEVTGLYLFIRSLTQDNSDLYLLLAVAVLIIAVVFYFLAPQILHVSRPITRILYCATFLLWVASIDVFTLSDIVGKTSITFIIPAAVAIWTFALPHIFDRLGAET